MFFFGGKSELVRPCACEVGMEGNPINDICPEKD